MPILPQLLDANLAVFFQCLRAPAEWQNARYPRGTPPRLVQMAELLGQEPASHTAGWIKASIGSGNFSVFDPWEKRNEFFRLTEGNRQDLLAFLQTVGIFGSPRDAGDPDPVPLRGPDGTYFDVPPEQHITEGSIWSIRRLIQGSMQDPKGNTKLGKSWDFRSRITLVSRPSGEGRWQQAAIVITTTTFLEALLLTLTVDRAKHATFPKCANRDCQIPFAKASKRAKKYCSRECQHLDTVRRGREKK